MKNFKVGDSILYLETGRIGKVVETNFTPNDLWVRVMFNDDPKRIVEIPKRSTMSLKELAIAIVKEV